MEETEPGKSLLPPTSPFTCSRSLSFPLLLCLSFFLLLPNFKFRLLCFFRNGDVELVFIRVTVNPTTPSPTNWLQRRRKATSLRCNAGVRWHMRSMRIRGSPAPMSPPMGAQSFSELNRSSSNEASPFQSPSLSKRLNSSIRGAFESGCDAALVLVSLQTVSLLACAFVGVSIYCLFLLTPCRTITQPMCILYYTTTICMTLLSLTLKVESTV